MLDGLQTDASIIDDERRGCRGTSQNHDRVATATFAGDREAAARKRIVDPIRERTLADDGKLGGRGERAADQWTEREDERGCGGQCVGARVAFFEEQPGAQAASSQELAQHRFRNRYPVDAPVRHVDAEIAPVITERR